MYLYLLLRRRYPLVGFLGEDNLPFCCSLLYRPIDPVGALAHRACLPEQLDHPHGGQQDDEAGHDADVDLLGGDGDDVGEAAKDLPMYGSFTPYLGNVGLR